MAGMISGKEASVGPSAAVPGSGGDQGRVGIEGPAHEGAVADRVKDVCRHGGGVAWVVLGDPGSTLRQVGTSRRPWEAAPATRMTSQRAAPKPSPPARWGSHWKPSKTSAAPSSRADCAIPTVQQVCGRRAHPWSQVAWRAARPPACLRRSPGSSQPAMRARSRAEEEGTERPIGMTCRRGGRMKAAGRRHGEDAQA